MVSARSVKLSCFTRERRTSTTKTRIDIRVSGGVSTTGLTVSSALYSLMLRGAPRDPRISSGGEGVPSLRMLADAGRLSSPLVGGGLSSEGGAAVGDEGARVPAAWIAEYERDGPGGWGWGGGGGARRERRRWTPSVGALSIGAGTRMGRRGTLVSSIPTSPGTFG